MGDSYYEYLLKSWLQGGKRDRELKRLYDNAVDGMMEQLLARSRFDDYLFVGERRGSRLIKSMQHLTCFVGGMLALGAHQRAQPDATRARLGDCARSDVWEDGD